MKILYCDPCALQTGGGNLVHNYELVTNLRKLGHVVVPLKVSGPRQKQEVDGNIRSSPWQRVKSRLRSVPLYKFLVKVMRILRFAWREGFIFLSVLIVVVRQKRQFDIIYRRHDVFNSEFLIARLLKIPSVQEVNAVLADEARIQNVGGSLIQRIIDTIERFNMPKADRIIVVTSKLKDVLHHDYHIPEEKIVVILNGANTDLFKPMDSRHARGELGLGEDSSYVSYIGSLSQWQGVEYLIKSAPLVLSKCGNTRFLVVGDGVLKEELVALAKQTGVSDRLIFTGFVPYDRVPLYINAGDVCVLPKKPVRGGYSPLKLCEYMACEKPVVATRTSGFEILEENDAGLLINPEDAQEFANAIIRLLEAPDLRRKMGENGRRYVVKERSWESVARRVVEVCQEAVEERKQRSATP